MNNDKAILRLRQWKTMWAKEREKKRNGGGNFGKLPQAWHSICERCIV